MAKAIKKGQSKRVLSEDFMESFEDFTPWEFVEFGVHSEEELSKLLNNLTSSEVREKFGVNSADTWDF
jgi:hypothetical protein